MYAINHPHSPQPFNTHFKPTDTRDSQCRNVYNAIPVYLTVSQLYLLSKFS